MTLWLLGYPAQALARLHEALALAHELSHPYSLAFAWCWAAFLSQVRRDVPALHKQAEAAPYGVSWKRLGPRTYRSTISAWLPHICSNCKSDSKR
jgi:hypothetical protein